MAVLALAVVGVLAAVIAQGRSSTLAPSPMMTLDPTTIVNLTQLPEATPLTGGDASEFVTLGQMVDACPDYDDARRSQMKQHIAWILNPAEIPPGPFSISLGPRPRGRLIFGMSTYTSSLWRLQGRKPGSCLITIGTRLNEMLVEAGEAPDPIFPDAAS